ncbi:MAG: DUF29 domain-containing protein [Cyanobacteriota bacterium]|jgi:hypothetical protein
MVTPTPLAQLYDQDYDLWLTETIEVLKTGQVERLDYENLIEEIEAMGRNRKDALESNLEQLLLHLLKWRYQPQKQTNSWRLSIREHSRRLVKLLKNSPSLKPYLESVLAECYEEARERASLETELPIETFPLDLPFSQENLLNPSYLPEDDADACDCP